MPSGRGFNAVLPTFAIKLRHGVNDRLRVRKYRERIASTHRFACTRYFPTSPIDTTSADARSTLPAYALACQHCFYLIGLRILRYACFSHSAYPGKPIFDCRSGIHEGSFLSKVRVPYGRSSYSYSPTKTLFFNTVSKRPKLS